MYAEGKFILPLTHSLHNGIGDVIYIEPECHETLCWQMCKERQAAGFMNFIYSKLHSREVLPNSVLCLGDEILKQRLKFAVKI